MALDVLIPLCLAAVIFLLCIRTPSPQPAASTLRDLWHSPALRAAAQRVPEPEREVRAALWAALARERDALHARLITAHPPGSPHAIAIATSALAWNMLALPQVHTTLSAPHNDAQAEQSIAILSALVAATAAPEKVGDSHLPSDHQRALLEDAARIREILFDHQRAFGQRASVSWVVFCTLALQHALPGVQVHTVLYGDRVGTAWAHSLVARTSSGHLSTTPFAP